VRRRHVHVLAAGLLNVARRVMTDEYDFVAGFILALMSKTGMAGVQSFRALCARNRTARRLLVATIVCLLFATHAHALPFGFDCMPHGSQAPSIECRLVPAHPPCFLPCALVQSPLTLSAPDGALGGIIDVLATPGTGSTLFGSIARLPPAFEINTGEPEQILFSLATHKSEIEVVVSMRNETLRAGMRETAVDKGGNRGLAEHSPVSRSAAVLLISSGIAGVAAASYRRRGQRLALIQAPWASRKEAVSNTTPVASLFAQRSSHSTPLRI
jgi:hypothetical protein